MSLLTLEFNRWGKRTIKLNVSLQTLLLQAAHTDSARWKTFRVSISVTVTHRPQFCTPGLDTDGRKLSPHLAVHVWGTLPSCSVKVRTVKCCPDIRKTVALVKCLQALPARPSYVNSMKMKIIMKP